MKSSYATDSIFLKRTLIFRRSSRYLLGALYTICIMLFSAGSSPVVNSMGTDSSVFFTIGRTVCCQVKSHIVISLITKDGMSISLIISEPVSVPKQRLGFLLLNAHL